MIYSTYPFATLTLKINNICCDDMQVKFKQRELGFDWNNMVFKFDGKLRNNCPYCGKLWEISTNTRGKIRHE